jgi:two-component system NtrC family sensor kinase
MDAVTVLILADTTEGAEMLRDSLAGAGYTVHVGDEFTKAPPCDVILIDVNHLRGSPFAALMAQRSMGATADAILIAPRLTGEMAGEFLSLGIRDFVRRPVENSVLLERLASFVEKISEEHQQEALRHELKSLRGLLTRRLGEMDALSRICRSITSLTEVDEILSRVIEAAVFLTNSEEGLIYVFDEESQSMTLRASQGLSEHELTAVQRPSPDSDVATVAKSGNPVIRTGSGSQSKITTSYLVRAAVNVPIILNRKVMGVIAVHRHGKEDFEKADESVLSALADYTAIALDKAILIGDEKERIDAALAAARNVKHHAETLLNPIDGIESQVNTLLSGGFDPLTESQQSAVSRIKLAGERLKEIAEFIREELAKFEDR